jgi:hypothetical protein
MGCYRSGAGGSGNEIPLISLAVDHEVDSARDQEGHGRRG